MAIRILQLKKLRKTVIICCALDFVGKNPMLAINMDNKKVFDKPEFEIPEIIGVCR